MGQRLGEQRTHGADAAPNPSEERRAVADTAPAPQDPRIGQLVAGRYRIDSLLGQGGMGAVYRATQLKLQRPVALKFLHAPLTALPDAVARFEREALAAGRISHPNVAGALDFGHADESNYYLALEYVDGSSLRQILAAEGALGLRRTVRFLVQLSRALAAAHALGIVHRDLKPENIMVLDAAGQRDSIKVLDFGLAKIALDQENERAAALGAELTREGAIFGTPAYMSPEQAQGKTADHRADLYALGVIAYEMLSGDQPFYAETPVVVLNKHVHEAPPPMPSDVPVPLARLVERLLAKAPEDRPQSATEVLTALAALDQRAELSKAAQTFQKVEALLWPVWEGATRAAGWLLLQARRHLVPLFHKLVDRWQLNRRVPLGPWGVPLTWLIAAGAGLALALAVGVWVTVPATPVAAPTAVPATATTTPPAPPATTPAPPPAVVPKLAKGTPEQQRRFAAIMVLPVYERTLDHWLTLGELYAATSDLKESVSAYRNAIQLDQRAAKNPALLRTVRLAAEQRRSYDPAINVAANLLGEAGMDLIYDVWQKTKNIRKLHYIATVAQRTLQIVYLRNASPALRVRLDLEFVEPEDCEAKLRILSRAIRDADARSVPLLQKLKSDKHCALAGHEDLRLALEAAADQAAPIFDARGYVAKP